MTIRNEFLARRPFELDSFQIEALDAIDSGDSVLVAAPTGSGKTLVAEYAVAVALAEGKKVFYTTPLKALSNQKYLDLLNTYGPEKVGLLTGDNAINGDAPAVVMTTEVLRNMIYAGSSSLKDLRFVVLDEVHYLQNAYRGPVWEEVIIHAPPEVTLVCLSATVSNAEELTDWISTVRGSTIPIIEERRPVTLNQHYLIATRGSDHLTMIPTFGQNGRPNPQGQQYDPKNPRKPWHRSGKSRSIFQTPGRTEVIEHLNSEQMLPAIYFIFSRGACDDAVRQLLNDNIRLTTPEERERIRTIAESKVESLSDEDLRVLDYGTWLSALEAGIASHHAGMVPPFKEAVEQCFGEALVKVIFATETLALGINMPARSVVIEKLTKFTGERHEFLTPGEYTQLTGRAGRRGIDDVGHAVVLWSPWNTFEQIAGLASARTYTLTSSFRPTYNMATNLVRRYPPDVAHHLLNLSFGQYRADIDVVRLEAQLESNMQRLSKTRQQAECELGDIKAWKQKNETSQQPKRDSPEFIAKALGHLKIGDVIRDPGTDSERHLLIVSTTTRRGHDVRLGVLSREGRRFNLTSRDFIAAPHRAGHIDLPKPYNPGNKDFIKRAAMQLGDEFTNDSPFTAKSKTSRKKNGRGVFAVKTTGVASCPDFERHLSALMEAERLERERDRLEKRVRSRSQSLARQFDRVLSILRELEYVEQWSLTQAGEQLRRVYHESDLLVVECLRRGLFDNLDPPGVGAIASLFTYETRGPSGTGPSPYFHTSRIEARANQALEIWEEISRQEVSAALPVTRMPDPGFCGYAYAWIAGEELDQVLEDEELSGGDFVRNVRQLIDLLRQISDVAEDLETQRAARQAAEALFRGIVAASSVLVGSSEEETDQNAPESAEE